MDKDYHELGIDAAETTDAVKRSLESNTPIREVPQPANIPTREVGSKYLKPGDKVRLRASDRQGEVVSLSSDLCDALVRWEEDDNDTGYYDVRDLVKRA